MDPAAGTITGSPIDADPAEVFAGLRAALAAHRETPADEATWARLVAMRRQASRAILSLARKEHQSFLADEARALVKDMAASGAHDRRVDAEDLHEVEALARKGWQGLLAAMLLAPAWQWPDTPLLMTVPDWLRADYVAWLFAAPQSFHESGQAGVYADHCLKCLEELERWIKRSPGATAEAEVLHTYARSATTMPLALADGSLRRHAEVRGRLLTRAFRQPGDSYAAVDGNGAGRRVRIGVVARDFEPGLEMRCALPRFERLDPERFEVVLFARYSGDSKFEARCRQNAANFFVLSDDLEGQLAMLRAAALDAAVFCGERAAGDDDLARMAVHRVAPLQVRLDSMAVTSGLPEIDLQVLGASDETAGEAPTFTERLGLVPGPTLTFAPDEDGTVAGRSWSRADLGLAEDAVIFAIAGDSFLISPEMQAEMARVLKAVPNAHVLALPGARTPSIERFCADFDRVLSTAGVEGDRLHVFPDKMIPAEEIRELLTVADVFLDTHPLSAGATLALALEAGRPVLVRDGVSARSRCGAGVLRSLGLAELVTTSSDEWVAGCERLAADAAARAELGERVADAMAKGPLLTDSLGQSDAFGELLLGAIEEIGRVGREAFRNAAEPLTAPTTDEIEATLATAASFLDAGLLDDARQQVALVLASAPTSVPARQLMARILLAQGQTARGTDYLIGAVQSGSASSDLWRELADAFQLAQNNDGALMALETSLRIDPKNVEAWFRFADLAGRCGHEELLAEVTTILAGLAPDDPRYALLLNRPTAG